MTTEHSIAQLVETYIRTLQADATNPNTLDAYARDLNQFTDYLPIDAGVSSVSDTVLAGYQQQLLDEGYKTSTVKRKIAALYGFISGLVMNGYIDNNPIEQISRVSVQKKPGKNLSQVELKLMLDVYAGSSDKFEIRDRAINYLLALTPLGVGDIVELRIDQIDVGEGYIRVPNNSIPMSSRLVSVIEQYLNIRKSFSSAEDSDYLLLSKQGSQLARTTVNHAAKKAGQITNLHFKVKPGMISRCFDNSQATIGGIDSSPSSLVQLFRATTSVVTIREYTLAELFEDWKPISVDEFRGRFPIG